MAFVIRSYNKSYCDLTDSRAPNMRITFLGPFRDKIGCSALGVEVNTTNSSDLNWGAAPRSIADEKSEGLVGVIEIWLV